MEDESLVKLLVNGDVEPSDVSDKLKICALRKKYIRHCMLRIHIYKHTIFTRGEL